MLRIYSVIGNEKNRSSLENEYSEKANDGISLQADSSVAVSPRRENVEQNTQSKDEAYKKGKQYSKDVQYYSHVEQLLCWL